MSVPDDQLEMEVKKVASRVIGEPVETGTNLLSAGATSISLIRLLAELEERFGVELSLVEFFEAPSLGTAIASIRVEREKK